MRAIVHNRYCILPDHSPQPGRVLVQTSLSARDAATFARARLARSTFAQMKERAGRVPGILKHDGVRFLFGKTSHLVRREMQRLDAHAASFVGHVIDDRSGNSRTRVGQRVAGASITHPPDTELVLARPEFIFPVHDRCADELASLALYGGLAVYASDEAMKASNAAIGVAGNGVLAQMVASILVMEGRPVARTSEDEPLVLAASAKRGSFASLREADVWIETEASAAPRGIEARETVGLAVPLSKVRLIWPHAQSHLAVDVSDVVLGGDNIVDLFYDDGEPEWPAWLEPKHIARYLDIATAGKIFTGPIPEPIEISSISPDEKQLATQLERARSSGRGIILTRFHKVDRRPDSRLLNLNTRRPPGLKTVSVVGVGEWPLGMILRQILRDERIALRGGCDRRPEVLNLARQALAFEFLTTSYEDLLDDNETDLIIVAPFHGVHAPLAAAALRAGKHCFVEKPPAINRDQLDSLIDAATASDRFLYVGYNRRFAPATQILLDHLANEEGPLTVDIVVHSVPIPRNNWYFWPSNGNRIISNTCHFIDYVLQLAAPARPIRVTATPSAIGRPDENVIIAVTFDDGSIGSITYTKRGSDRGPTYYQSYHVMKGGVTGLIEDFARLVVHRHGKRVAAWRSAIDVGHRSQMRLVADALASDGESPVALDVAFASAVTVLAADESARIGEPVDVDVTRFVHQTAKR
jgi:predicted dehydrogenase